MKPKTITKTIQAIIAIMALTLIISACTNTAQTNTPSNVVTGANVAADTNTNPPATTPTTTDPNAGLTKLSDSKYANSAYLISADTLDSAAQTAISGFMIKKTTNADGTTTFDLTSSNPEYKNQSYTLTQGQKLYFIERMLGDDSNNEEFNLGDDTAIIVNADGYIVQ